MPNSQIISLKNLYYTDFELTDIFAIQQKWIVGSLFKCQKPRPTTGIIYLKNCKGIYTSKSGESFEALPGSIVCLPEGSEYTCFNADCSSTNDDAILIEFNMIKGNEMLTFSNKPFIIKDINVFLTQDLLSDIVKAYNSVSPSPLKTKSAVYHLLSYLSEQKFIKHHKKYNSISAGIEIIESSPLSKITIEEIAQICNVSPCYFRRLFKEYSGKSPNEYRIDARLNMAKKLLRSNEVTVDYIAETLNFESTSYFCRLFKKKFGITTSNFLQE